VHLRTLDHRDLVVEQLDQASDQPGLALTALAQHDDVVAGQNRSFQSRDDRVVVSDDPGEELDSGPHLCDEVVAKLFFHAPLGPTRGLQVSEGARTRFHERTVGGISS
jgi:hypothetical protein